jgi:hypothetical protein
MDLPGKTLPQFLLRFVEIAAPDPCPGHRSITRVVTRVMLISPPRPNQVQRVHAVAAGQWSIVTGTVITTGLITNHESRGMGWTGYLRTTGRECKCQGKIKARSLLFRERVVGRGPCGAEL